MHPKFIIKDRTTVVLPSCNISWEQWFEGCITFSGPIAGQFLNFYNLFWNRQDVLPLPVLSSEEDDDPWHADNVATTISGHAHTVAHYSSSKKSSDISDIHTIFLPSPHRRNPRFRPLTTTEKIVAPPTPLNSFILTVLAKAKRSIRIQTPNITSPPVLSLLLKALERGVNVKILTSAKLMILEQLVTAGTTTSRCMKKLIKRYQRLARPDHRQASDEEVAIPLSKPGRLQISYFEPVGGLRPRGKEAGEPQQSHLKLMLIDEEVLVLGSGNLDRASWFTSQELGVAFFDKELSGRVGEVISRAMEGRSHLVYESA